MSEVEDKINIGGMMGDEGIPVVEEPVEAPVEEPVETPAEPEPEPETPEPETPEEPTAEPQPTDLNALADQLGIIKQFGSVENALRQIPETNRYNTQLQQERATWRKQQEQTPIEKTPPIDGQSFFDDPAGSLNKMGIPDRAEIQRMVTQEAAQMMDNQRVEDFIESKEDYHKREPQMASLYQRMPELDRLPRAMGLDILYRLSAPSSSPKPAVTPAPGAEKKDRASTAGGRATGKATPDPTAKGAEETLAQMEERLGFSDN